MAPARESTIEIAFAAPSTTAFDTACRFPVEIAKIMENETRTKKHFSIIKLAQPLDNLCKNDIIFSRKINFWEALYEILARTVFCSLRNRHNTNTASYSFTLISPNEIGVSFSFTRCKIMQQKGTDQHIVLPPYLLKN